MMISYYLPEHTLTNDDLATEFNDDEWSAESIFHKTGIVKRHIAGEGESTSSLLEKAAKKLFDEYSVTPEEIGFVILCTQTPDYPMPGTACIMQDKLGIPKTSGAFDINLGCSGYVYGLMVAKGLISSGQTKNVLFLTSDMSATTTKVGPKASRVIFGDAATATFLTPNNINKIGKNVYGTDGSGAIFMRSKYGGTVHPINKRTYKDVFEKLDANGDLIDPNADSMNGPEIFSFTLRTVPGLVKEALKVNDLSLEDIDYFIFHQANGMILSTLTKMMKLPKDKVIFDIEEVGNTSSNSVPITLKRAMERSPEKFKPGTKVLISGFGVGYSWSASVLTL